MANEDRLKLFKAIGKAGYDIGNYEDFDRRMNNAEDRQKFYTAVNDAGFDIGPQEDFERRISPSKYKIIVNGKDVQVSEKEYLDFLKRHPSGTNTTPKPQQPQSQTKQQLPQGFGQLDTSQANRMGMGRGPVSDSWEQPEQETEPTVLDVTSGRAPSTPQQQKQVQKRMQQRQDELAYESETGKRLNQPVLNPSWEAPTVARDDFGNIRHDENGNIMTGFTTDQAAAGTHRQITQEQAEWDKLSDEEKRERAKTAKLRAEEVSYKEPTLWDTVKKSSGSGIVRKGAEFLDFMQQMTGGMIIEDPSSPTGYTKLPTYEEAVNDKNNPITRLSNYANETADRWSREAQPLKGKGYLDMLWDGELGALFQKGVGTALESLPNTLSAFNPVTMIANGVLMASGNYREQVLENPDIPEWKRTSMAIGMAAIEQLTEKYSDPFFKYLGGSKLFRSAGKEAAEEAVNNITKEATENIAKRIFGRLAGIGKDAAGEGAEEIISNFGSDTLGELLDLADGQKNYGIRAQWAELKKKNPDADLWTFAMDKAKEYVEAGIGGGMAGAYMSGTAQASAKALEYAVGKLASKEQIAQNPNTRIDPATLDIAQAYDEGYNSDNADAKKSFADEAKAAEEILPQYGQEFAKMVTESQSPVETMDYLMQNRDLYTDEQIEAAADYFQKRAASDGVMEGEIDRINQAVDQANAEVVADTHQATGQVIMAQIGDGLYYLIGGDVATDEATGMPVVTGTGGAVVVKNVLTGEVSVKPAGNTVITSMTNADEMIQYNENVLRQQLMQQADDDITFGSPASEVFDLEDTVTLQDGNGGMIEGQIVALPNAVDGVFVIQTNDGRALQMTADDMNRRIVAHNGMEVQRGNNQNVNQINQNVNQNVNQVPENAETGTDVNGNVPEGQINGQINQPEASAEAVQQPESQQNGKGEETEPQQSALSRIPVRTDKNGQPLKNKKGRPVLDWHKASVEDAAAALVETTGGNMVMARDTASDLVRNEQARLEKIRKQKPKGDDPIEIAESRMEIQKQVDEVQAVIKQWQDVGSHIRKQMEAEAAEKRAAEEAAKSEEQRQREAEEARIRKEKQDAIAAERRRRQIEEEVANWNKPYAPLAKARKEMEGDREAMDILNRTEPESLEEWVSSLIQPQSMMWDDETDPVTGRTVIGLQSELGLQKKDIERIGGLVAPSSKGGKPFGQVVHDIWEALPEGMKQMYDDQDVRNALIGLFGEGNTKRMRHLTEEHRIEEARQLQKENARRDAEAEMDAWAEAYHLTPEERETFDEWTQMPPTEPEQEVINQIIADNEQNRTSPEMGGQPVGDGTAAGIEGGEGQVLEAVEAAGNGNIEETPGSAAEAGTGQPAPADNNVPGGESIFVTPVLNVSLSRKMVNDLAEAYASGDPSAIQSAVVAMKAYVDEGGDFENKEGDSIYDYDGNDPQKLALQYKTHLLLDTYLDDDEDQEYIKTGLKPEMRQSPASPDEQFTLPKLGVYPAQTDSLPSLNSEEGPVKPSEQTKPTDLRDAVRPESAELGVNEAKARARYQLSSTEKDAEGNTFYKKDGSIDLWSLPELFKKARRQTAPIRLTDRNLQHIIDEHGKEIGDAEKVFDFLDDVFSNATVLRMARGRAMFVVVENEKTDKAAIIKLMPSEAGDYYNVESAGYYRKNKWKGNEDVIADLSEPDQSDAAADVSKPQTPGENGGETINAETQASSSEGKVTNNSSNLQEKTEKSSPLGKTSSPEEVAAEEARVDTNPTDAQKEAGNYQKGHIKVDGYDITIENPKGSVRSGVDQNGKEWSQEMHNTYGYIRGTEGTDGDHIDIFLSDDPTSGNVYVVDQVKPDGSFDEVKVMYGFADAAEATKAYLSNYEDGWKGLGAISGVSREAFKEWIESSRRKTKPFRDYALAKREQTRQAKENENKLNNDYVISDIDENDVPLQKRSRKSYTDREGVYHEGLGEELERIEESIRNYLDSDTAAGDNGLSPAEVPDVVPVEASAGMVEGTETRNREIQQRQPTIAELRRRASIIRAELAGRQRAREELRQKYNINEKGDISLDDLARMFRDLNSDEAIGRLFERVLGVLKKLKLNYRFTDKLPEGLNGRAQTLLNMTFYDWDAQTRDMDDQQKARVLLHEMIHNVTSQILLYARNMPLLLALSPKQLSAARKLNRIYKEVKKASPKRANGKDFYALDSVDEMVAELANPEFREALSQIEVDGRSLWQRIKDAIREMLGLETTPNMSNALKESGDVLEDILDTFGPVRSFVHGVPRQAMEAGEKIFGDNENLTDNAEADLQNSKGNDIQDDSANQPVFVSNAMKAVEGISQEKATPEQWLKMIEKGGGLKAGEDKWIGLSDWLKVQDKKSLTKQEVMDYIRQNQIQVEEVNYSNRRAFDKNGKVDSDSPINSTRLKYTTEGLDNKKEIVLTVPTVDPYNADDEIHFGDAGGGRAVAWIRFGDAYYNKNGEPTEVDSQWDAFMDRMAEKYGKDRKDTLGLLTEMTDEEREEMNRLDKQITAKEKRNMGRVLVIDEIQSKRHQDGRESGYRTEEFDRTDARIRELESKESRTADEEAEYRELMGRLGDMLRENPHPVPSAPFEKNWHELAMKRMLRYAAENGYDKIAWTTGAQQAERYSLSHKVSKLNVMRHKHEADRYAIIGRDKYGDQIIDKELTKEELPSYLGKELASRVLNGDFKERNEDWDMFTIEGEDLNIGGEGMKGFYDQMLPRFMDKYGKKWGVKTGEIELPGLEESARRMHSVDITPEMKESVMQGQPMFQKAEAAPEAPAQKERTLRDALVNLLKSIGIDVITDNAEGQHTLDESKGKDRPQKVDDGSVAQTVDMRPIEERVVRNPNIRETLDIQDEVAKLTPEEVVAAYKRINSQMLDEEGLNIDEHEAKVKSDYISKHGIKGVGQAMADDFNAQSAKYGFGMMSLRWDLLDRIEKEGLQDMLDQDEAAPLQAKVYDMQGRPVYFKTKDGQAYGYTYNGKIYLDPAIATAETPVHEYTHLWAEAVRQNDPKTWENIMDVLKNDPAVQPFWDKVAAQYPELTDENDIAEEVLAQYSGRRGSEKLREVADEIAHENGGIFGKAQAVEALRRMRNILAKFWKAVADVMGWQYSRADEIADKVLYDLLSGVKPETEGRAEVREQKEEPPTVPPSSSASQEDSTDPSQEPVNMARQIYEDAIRDTGERMMIPSMVASLFNKEARERFKHKFAESYFDYSRSIKALQDAIEKATGNAIKGFEDVWRTLNAKSSIDNDQIQKVMHDLIEPLSEFVGNMVKDKEIDGRRMTLDDVEKYMNAVHGIERNVGMAMKQARDEYEEDTALMRQQLESGEVSGKERKSVEDALLIKEARYNGIKNYMDNEVVAKWYNQWKRGLENARRNGTITEDEYNKSKARMEEEYEHGWQYKYRDKDYSGLTALFADDFKDGEKPTEDQLEQAARDYAARFEGIVGKDAAEGLWNHVKALNEWSLRKSYESGLISKDQYKDTLSMYKHYVPLRGWHDDYAGDVYQYISRGEPAEVLQGVLKKAYGRKSRAARIFGTMAAMANTAIVQGNKNLVAQHLLNMALNHKDAGLLMPSEQYYQKNADGQMVPQVPALNDDMTPDEMRRELERFEADMKAREDAGEVQTLRSKFRKEFPLHMAKWQEQRHAVRVMRNGKEYMVYVLGNPRAAEAFNGLLNPNSQPGAISNVISMWNRWLAKWQTSLSPEFLFSNFQRDVMTATTGAYIKFGNDYKRQFEKNILSVMPLTKATVKKLKGEEARNLGGIFSLFRKYDSGTLDMNDETERLFKEFIEGGGMTGISHITKAEEYQESMEKMVRRMRQGKMGKVRKGWEAVGDTIEFLNKGIENATRFAAYMTSRQQGKSIRDSIFDAKEASVNFNMKGSGAWGNMMARRLYLYVNPAMQALRMLGTWYENDPVVAVKEGGKMVAKAVGKRFLKTAAGVVAASVTCAVVNKLLSELLHGDDGDDDDKEKGDWWALSEWNRYNYINVINPFGKGYFHWSIPQELRPLWAMGQIAVDMAYGRKTWQRGLQSMALQLNNLSPLSFFEGGTDGGETVIESELRTMTPSFLAPFFDAYFWNRDFMGRKITNRTSFNREDPEWKRAGEDTPKAVVRASRRLNNITGGADNSRGWLEDNILGGTTNPSALYYLATQQFGGVGSMAKRLFNLIDQASDKEKEVELRNIPFVPKVYVSTGDDYSKQRVINDKFWMYYNEYKAADHEIKKNRKDVEAKEMSQDYADKRIEERKADGTYNTWKVFKDNEFDYIFDQVRDSDLEYEVKRMVVDAIENGRMPDYDAMLNTPGGDHSNDALWAKARNKQYEHTAERMTEEEAFAEFDKSDDPRLRKELAKRISKDAGASQDPYGDKPSSDHAYQYQLQRTADDVYEDALLYAHQEKLRKEGREDEKKRLSKERSELHSSSVYLHGGRSDSVIMQGIRTRRENLLERYGLQKNSKKE